MHLQLYLAVDDHSVDVFPCLLARRLGMIGGLRGRMDVGKDKDKETNQNAGLKYGPRFLKIKNVDKATKIPFMFMYKVIPPF